MCRSFSELIPWCSSPTLKHFCIKQVIHAFRSVSCMMQPFEQSSMTTALLEETRRLKISQQLSQLPCGYLRLDLLNCVSQTVQLDFFSDIFKKVTNRFSLTLSEILKKSIFPFYFQYERKTQLDVLMSGCLLIRIDRESRFEITIKNYSTRYPTYKLDS